MYFFDNLIIVCVHIIFLTHFQIIIHNLATNLQKRNNEYKNYRFRKLYPN